MVKKDKSSNWIEFACVFVFFNLVVWGILIGTGTLTCGYHMVDDHEILEWVSSMKFKDQSLGSLMAEVIKQDLGMRYRPLYYILRVLGAYLLGINMTAFSVVNGIEIALTMILLYYCGRNMGAPKWSSSLFALIAMIGYQSCVWWKLGPQESLGTMLFALGFWSMQKWLENKRKVWAAGSLLVLFLMCNYKESYMLLLPFVGLYVVYDCIKNEEKLPAFSEMPERMKGNLVCCLPGRLFYLYGPCSCISCGSNGIQRI